MDNTKIKKEILDLQKKINEWDNAYYNLDSPIVSDEIYDAEINKLIKLEKQYASLFTYEELKNSPTQKINASSLTIFKKVNHDYPMLSLNKAYSLEEIQKFIDNIKKNTLAYSLFIEPKIDGLSISLKYHNGKLIQALTRGDGLVGEDVTQNALQISDIPKEIDYKKNLEVRGEVYLSLSIFNELNNNLKLKGNIPFSNPRNAAAGTLRQLDPKIVAKRNLSAFLYYIINPQEHNIKTMNETFMFLQKHNFKTTNIYKVLTSLDEIEKYINDFKNQKLLLDYETDGIVIKLNELKYYDMLGQTQKFPHWAIAFKYEPNIAETKIKSIFVTIGRTGLVTYNCSLDPTQISGSIVEYATLNNYNYVKELNLNVNDKVYVKKAGEIIPCIIGLVSYKNKIDVYPHIDKCPYCNSLLYNANNYLEEYCLNRNCPEINKRKLIHFASKDCMNFFSMGEKIIDKFIQLGYLNSVTDFYTLKEYIASLTKLDNFGPKSILKILDSIEKSRENSLESLLFGLSIKHIGQKVATFIASKVLKLSNFLTYNFDLLISYNEIGEKIIGSLKQWVSEQENINIVNKLIDLGLDLEYKSNIKSKTFENISFVITGTLSKPRNYFEQIIKTNNGNIMNAISKKTTYLLCGDDAGSKLKKAKELNIKIISEDEFYNLLKTNESK